MGGWQLSDIWHYSTSRFFTPVLTAHGGLADNRPDLIPGQEPNLPANELPRPWLRRAIKEHKPGEILFFCTHIPVVPYNARSNWLIYVHPDQAKEREELLNLLGARRAIVLSGHLHKTSIVVRSTPSGNFVQVGLGSVVSALDAAVRDHLKGPDAYSAKLVDLEPVFSPSSLSVRKEILEKEKPYIRYYEYADFPGYSSIAVDRHNEVEITVFVNADKTPWSKTNLTHLLKS